MLSHPLPAKKNFGGEVIGEQNLSDIWVGLTWSTLLSSKVGFGITQFVSARSQNTRLQIIAHALKTDTTLATGVLLRQLKYTNFRLLWKAGIGINLKPLTLGFTLTTPSLNLFGSGFSLYDEAVNGLGQDYWAANFQDGLASKYKSSWAFGGGAGYKIKNIRLHFSAEWFDAVKEFDVLATEDFKAQSADTIISPRVSAELKSVLNWGTGLEVLFNKKISGYGSFVSDYSAAVLGTQSVTTISNWDIYHISAGTLLKIGSTDLTLGVTYAFGSNDFERLADLSTPEGGVELEQPNKDVKFKYSRLKFIFGFSFAF